MIPFVDLKSQHAEQAQAIEAAALEVLRSGGYVSGERVKRFEANFATYCGAAESMAVNTGTSALHLALEALGIGEGDEVLTTPSTFVATVAAIHYAGATPVYADIDEATWNIDPAAIEAAITPRTKAIIPVHLHGRLADMDAILKIANARGLPVIEDAAQAHGAQRGAHRAGSSGVLGCFSFYPSKNLGACGEGGAVTTSDPDLAAKIRLLRDWGQTKKYEHTYAGYNFRMDELQGALLDIKLTALDGWTERRRAIAACYDKRLGAAGVTTPAPSSGKDHVYHVYAVRVADRDRVMAGLQAAGVGTAIHYPKPVHLQPAYASPAWPQGSLPKAERFAAETVSLPMHPFLSEAQAEEVCQVLLSVI